ncbi:MAG: hypothetical protein ABJC79_03910 [Acidimicrobiia bacterium]
MRRFLATGRLVTAVVLGATLAFHALYLLPLSRHLAEWLMREDLVVEDITFLSLLAASILGAALTYRARRNGEARLTWILLGLLATGLFFVAMEEISWGQWVFFFKTPGTWKHLNRQGETNLHNLPGLWGHSEYLRLIFAAGGLAAVWAGMFPGLRKLATPRALLGTFVVITSYVVLDMVDDLFAAPWFFKSFSALSEWDEMLIGLAALAYMVIKWNEWLHPDADVPVLASTDLVSPVAEQFSPEAR